MSCAVSSSYPSITVAEKLTDVAVSNEPSFSYDAYWYDVTRYMLQLQYKFYFPKIL